MPPIRAHLHQARHNQAFLDELDRRAYPDWFVTACFYRALHLLDAYLASVSVVDVGNHEERQRHLNNLLRQALGFRPAWNRYRALRDLSEGARYRCQEIAAQDVENAQSDYLRRIDEWVRDQLGIKGFGHLL